jgi:hypothetical protein
VWGLFGFTYYGIILFVSRLYTTSSDDDKSSCSFDYSAIFINATAEIAGVTVSAIAIDRLGRIHTQTFFYLWAGVAVAIMGMGIPVGAVLAVSIVGRMAVMAASVETICSSTRPQTDLHLFVRTRRGSRLRSFTTRSCGRWVTPCAWAPPRSAPSPPRS